MLNNAQQADKSYSLLIIIVSRGRGSKVLQFARAYGANEASGFLGKGTIKNDVLKLIEMNDIKKEIILIVVPANKEQEILNELNIKFHFDKPSHGIAFTMPLAGILKLKSGAAYKHKETNISGQNPSKHTGLFIIANKDMAESVIEISQNAGYYGGTIIKARGSASALNIVLDMEVETEKEAVLILTESHRAQKLADLLNKELNLSDENTGILVMFEINRTLGLYGSERDR